ncbi:hypothetical protein K0C01_02435 [Salinarchaeum sp. IM2453]|nr:hypothetical protein [Salinarchaeum sp. IM2453]QZA89040.1 hypothetical protein K0C01_02435 [Salinarchaeum sp. IM2453]
MELRLLSTPATGVETGVVGSWWSDRLPWTHRRVRVWIPANSFREG